MSTVDEIMNDPIKNARAVQRYINRKASCCKSSTKYYHKPDKHDKILEKKRATYAMNSEAIKRLKLAQEDEEDARDFGEFGDENDEIPPPEHEPEPEPVAVAATPAGPKKRGRPSKRVPTDPNPTKAPTHYKTLGDLMTGMIFYKEDSSMNSYSNHFSMIINTLKSKDFQRDVQNPTHVINAIKATYDKPSVQKCLCQAIVFAADHIHLSLTPEAKKQYNEAFALSKVVHAVQQEEDYDHTKIPRPEVYLKNTIETYGQDSMQYFVSAVSIECACRDDLQLQIVQSVQEDESKNYAIVYPRVNSRIIIVLNNYKTRGLYGQGSIELSSELSRRLHQYMNEHHLTYGDYLFGDQKLTKFVGEMNTQMGLKELGVQGNCNLFRHMVCSSLLEGKKNLDAKTRYDVAKKMFHSPAMSQKYLRKFMDEELK